MSLPARILVFASGLIFILALFFSFSPFYTYAASSNDVLINEVYYDVDSTHGSEGSNEWVELYNPNDFAVTISNWTIADNKYERIIPEATISAKGFALITNQTSTWDFWSIPKAVAKIALGKKIGSGLSNSGDYLVLKDSAGDVVDEVSYGSDTVAFEPSCQDVKEGHSLERSPFGFDSDQALDFVDQDSPSPGVGYMPPVYSDQVFINEIMPDPVGADSEGEYLELYNAGGEAVDLEGWKIGVGGGTSKTLGDQIKLSSYLIPAGGFLVVYRKDSHSVLSNGGDTVVLLSPDNITMDTVAYSEVDEGWVYQRYPDGSGGWSVSDVPTVGEPNQLGSPNFNSSNSSVDSTAPSGIELTFSIDGSDLKVNRSFNINLSFTNAKPWHDYRVKVRLGLAENKLTKGRTYNSFYNAWLADNSAWANFPDLYTDSHGSWGSDTITAKVASGNPAGEYFIVVRLRDNETGENYDAAVQTIHIGEEDVSDGESGKEVATEITDPGVVLGAAVLPLTGPSASGLAYLGLLLGIVLRGNERKN
jgi:hypothetical protein